MISNEQERRGQYPFDIRHRHVLSYEPDSPQDFERLQTELVSRLKALMDQKEQMRAMADMESSERIASLSPHEVAVLRTVLENQSGPYDGVSAPWVQNEMVEAGFNKIAATLAFQSLLKRGYIEAFSTNAQDSWIYRATESGNQWGLDNQDLLVDAPAVGNARGYDEVANRVQQPTHSEFFITDDESPF